MVGVVDYALIQNLTPKKKIKWPKNVSAKLMSAMCKMINRQKALIGLKKDVPMCFLSCLQSQWQVWFLKTPILVISVK